MRDRSDGRSLFHGATACSRITDDESARRRRRKERHKVIIERETIDLVASLLKSDVLPHLPYGHQYMCRKCVKIHVPDFKSLLLPVACRLLYFHTPNSVNYTVL